MIAIFTATSTECIVPNQKSSEMRTQTNRMGEYTENTTSYSQVCPKVTQTEEKAMSAMSKGQLLQELAEAFEQLIAAATE
jgi:hypothetical protein